MMSVFSPLIVTVNVHVSSHVSVPDLNRVHRGAVNGTASLSSFAVDAYLLSTRRNGIITVATKG